MTQISLIDPERATKMSPQRRQFLAEHEQRERSIHGSINAPINEHHRPQRPTATHAIAAEKLILLMMRWGWRGRLAFALVVFALWVLSQLAR